MIVKAEGNQVLISGDNPLDVGPVAPPDEDNQDSYMTVKKVSWKKLEIKIKTTEIKLLKDTMLVIKSRRMK